MLKDYKGKSPRLHLLLKTHTKKINKIKWAVHMPSGMVSFHREHRTVTKLGGKAIFYNVNVFLTGVIIGKEVNYYNYYCDKKL